MSDLLQAIFKCDLGILKSFINDGENVNCKVPGTEGCTILHIVAGMKKHARKDELLSYLLHVGANPNARSYEDLTPVHIAAMWNKCAELEKLLQNKGNPWLVDNENKNAFDLAADHHSYEAYQLLNKYLSENKLQFRTVRFSDQINLNNQAYNHSCDNSNIAFQSANEHFPLMFSSSEEEEESRSYLLDVSKIMGKNKLPQNCANKSKNTMVGSKKTELLDNALYLSNSEVSSGGSHSGSSNVTVIETGAFPGIVLIEEDSLLLPTHSTNRSSTFLICDWKSCRSDFSLSLTDGKYSNSENFTKLSDNAPHGETCDVTSCKSDFSFISGDSKAIPNSYKKLSNSEIFQELRQLGDKPGPVSEHTRDVYLKRLMKIKSGNYVPMSLSEPRYCSEMQRFISGGLNMTKIRLIANKVSEEFNDSKTQIEWREGNQKCCFNYFLLDPRVTQNLPARHAELTFQETFQNFIDAIFYVGKGTKGRPYSHLSDAVKALAGLHSRSDKINHILDVWNAGYGVVSLHCFNNCKPVEAYTQEACIIEALGLKNLTNIKSGDYYGQTTKWKRTLKRQVGILFLYKALQIYLNEGEKQIKAKDLRK